MAVYKNEERGTYFCTFYYTDWTGKRKRKKKEGFKKKKEAADFEREFLNKQKNNCDMNFKELSDLYLEHSKTRIRVTTFQVKEIIIKERILPYFKDMNVNNITPNNIRKWQNKLMSKDYKQTYLKAVNKQLNAIFNFAIKYYNLNSNPALKAGPMGKKDSEGMQFWTLEEYKEFIKCVDNPMCKLAFEILFWTGLRKGELEALTFSDIDTKNKIISITKTYTRINKKDIINPPKTPKSKRKVSISDFLCEDIENYKKKLYNFDKNERIFPVGRHILKNSMRDACEKSSVKEIRIHDLRHSHASLLIELGFSPLLIKERLGHENIQTTLDTYSHLYPNKGASIADKLDDLF
ncbi:site-specific integrase [Clostridium botulinum]|uniref:Phage integrase n=2 Tax=Clostridium botulinum TaxID=1491 RepID=A5I2E7_CLOBH|nr:site-specific integrase [Clostridium botulinum]ACQ53835.1 site-specific recombinase, phage integrase family [Clostridium botulinum Ba4 str. 657]MBY6897968.1 site-specific integrase [Clostridium botulinum]MBY6912282.1 site-specific integrase [Clostridium botulinum]MCR1176450.1 site-specific integrase [Clostridium botulinum]NEZ80542.1 site-specific integrase [Clostridium botulinum]